jgi:hypothetical protein
VCADEMKGFVLFNRVWRRSWYLRSRLTHGQAVASGEVSWRGARCPLTPSAEEWPESFAYAVWPKRAQPRRLRRLTIRQSTPATTVRIAERILRFAGARLPWPTGRRPHAKAPGLGSKLLPPGAQRARHPGLSTRSAQRPPCRRTVRPGRFRQGARSRHHMSERYERAPDTVPQRECTSLSQDVV